VTVGHRATVHGCRVEDAALVGIGSIVLDGARVGEGAVVGAGAVVPPGATVEPGMLVVGIPARPVRPIRDEEREQHRLQTLAYVENARAHAAADAATDESD
jgi:carbonic anhydrase/acetyltransferase-like protein (isoleucine patch superfamily)